MALRHSLTVLSSSMYAYAFLQRHAQEQTARGKAIYKKDSKTKKAWCIKLGVLALSH